MFSVDITTLNNILSREVYIIIYLFQSIDEYGKLANTVRVKNILLQ